MPGEGVNITHNVTICVAADGDAYVSYQSVGGVNNFTNRRFANFTGPNLAPGGSGVLNFTVDESGNSNVTNPPCNNVSAQVTITRIGDTNSVEVKVVTTAYCGGSYGTDPIVTQDTEIKTLTAQGTCP